MKNFVKILFIFSLLTPLIVFGEITSETQVIAAQYQDDNDIKNKCMDAYSNNIGYNTETKTLTAKTVGNTESFYYLDVIGVKCVSSKNVLKLMVKTKEESIVCTNGNKNPYFKLIASGLENPATGAQSLAENSSCDSESLVVDGDGYYAYGTRVFQAQCAYVDDGNGNKKDYVVEPTSSSTTNPVSDSTQSTSQTVKSPETGVEDYFITLGITGSILLIAFYIIEKKNVFKRI